MSAIGISFEIPRFLVGIWPANIDMSVETTPGEPGPFQYSFVDLVYAGAGVSGFAGAALGAPVSAGVPALGILQNNPQKNEAGTVMLSGISKAQIGTGGVLLNQILMAKADGTLVPATAGNYGVAKALCDASFQDISAVLLGNFGKQ